MDSLMLGGGGTIVDNEIQQMIAADVAQPRGKHNRKDLVVANRFVQSGNQMFLANGAVVEELL